jgi:large subunit ribosomal protein L29
MKAEELKTKTKDELVKTLMDLKKEQFNLRLQKSQGQVSNSANIRDVRRNVARVQTFLNKLAAGVVSTEVASPKKAKKASAK